MKILDKLFTKGFTKETIGQKVIQDVEVPKEDLLDCFKEAEDAALRRILSKKLTDELFVAKYGQEVFDQTLKAGVLKEKDCSLTGNDILSKYPKAKVTTYSFCSEYYFVIRLSEDEIKDALVNIVLGETPDAE